MDILIEAMNGDFGSAYTFISERMNGMLTVLVANPVFVKYLKYFATLGSIIAVVYFMLDLMDMYATDSFSMEKLFKEMMKLIACMMFMNNLSTFLLALCEFSDQISIGIIDAVNSAASRSSGDQYGIITKTLGSANKTQMYTDALKGDWLASLGDVFNALVGIVALFSIQLLCYFLSIKRTIGILWQLTLSPLAIADFVRENSTSRGIQTIHSMLGLFLEAPVAVGLCIVIDAVTASAGALNLFAAIIGIKLLWQYFLSIGNYSQRIVRSGNSGLIKY